jgi:tetratricopeptide (TPR) repeat protein
VADPRAFRVPLSREEWEQETRALLDEGQWFLAYDLARTGLERHPDSTHLAHFLARALTRTGALEEARRILEPLCAEYRPDPESLRSLHHALQQAMTLRIPEDQPVSDSAVATLGQLLAELSRAISAAPRTTAATAETWGLLGRVYKDIWRETGRREDAVRSRDIYLRGFDLTGDHFPGINAATMSWLIGEKGTAMELAERVLKACSLLRDEPRRMLRKVENLSYWLAATEGEAQLLIAEGQADTARGRAAPRQALRSYRRAARLAGRNHAFVDSTLQQLRLLAAEGFPVPPSLFRLFKPAVVVAFSGHMIDRPGRTPPRFPPALEGPVRSEIERVIEQLDARVGFCSAACGADLLFIEAMLARGAEVNVVLPFELQSFVETSVEHAGARWVARLHNALALVKTLKYVSEEPYLGDDELFAFANRIFLGMAELRAGSLAVRPHLVALLDGEADRVSGGTADVVAGWGDASRLRTIRLDVLRAANPAGAQVSN